MTYFYLLFLGVSFIFSFLINSLFLRFSKNLGIRDKKETIIRWASTSKPAFGGISFYIGFLISFASYSILFPTQEVLMNKKIIGLLSTVTIAFMMGLADDAYNTKPFLKFFVQILCGGIACYTDMYINIFQNMPLNYLVTILWVVGIMNSINLLDNMDSIAAIVSILIFAAAAMLVLLASAAQNNIHFLILLGLIGSLSGFLIFNWNPSKLYMGDAGSQVIGMMLAATGIIYFWNSSSPALSGSLFISKKLIIVMIAFLLPLVDTTVVVINRLSAKRSPFIGGRDHTTHHLFFRGITEKKIAVLFAGIGLLSLLIIYYIQTQIITWGLVHLVFFALYPLTVFLALFAITKIKKPIIEQGSIFESSAQRLSTPLTTVNAKKNTI
jgi:UDP-GlcNAc:undecaprenyl-phosphate/decaprenyl-phosphate GlcNAc-1-phosphate transferase